MKVLRKLALVLTIMVSAITMAGIFPELTNQFPHLKSWGQKLRSWIKASPAHTPVAPAVFVQIPAGSRLSAGQVQFLEQHKRRHELLREALQ